MKRFLTLIVSLFLSSFAAYSRSICTELPITNGLILQPSEGILSLQQHYSHASHVSHSSHSSHFPCYCDIIKTDSIGSLSHLAKRAIQKQINVTMKQFNTTKLYYAKAVIKDCQNRTENIDNLIYIEYTLEGIKHIKLIPISGDSCFSMFSAPDEYKCIKHKKEKWMEICK